MLPILAACVLSFCGSEPIVAAVPNSPVQIRIPLEGFAKVKAIAYGTQAIVAGMIPPEGTQISILWLTDPVEHTSAEWRDIRVAEHEQGMKSSPFGESGLKFGPVAKFDVDETACDEKSIDLRPDASAEQGRIVDWHAYVVAARFCFQIHVSSTKLGDGSVFGRDDFAKIVKSFEVGIFRKGSFKDYPETVVDFTDQATRHFPAALDWIASEAAKRKEDWVPSFVLGELSHVLKEPSKGITGYESAIPLLKQLAQPTAQETFVHIRAEHGLGLALMMDNRIPDALPHYLEARTIAAGAKSPEHAPLAYVVAMTYAGLKDPANTAKYLKEAISLDPKFRDEAKKNPFIQKLSANAAIKPLLEDKPQKN